MNTTHLFITLIVVAFLCITSCKKDCPNSSSDCDSVPDTCNRTYHYLNNIELTFVNFLEEYDTLRYYKNNTSVFLFDRTLITNKFAQDCNVADEYRACAYVTNSNINQIHYLIFPFDSIHNPYNFAIRIGAFEQSCQSYFNISTSNEIQNLDSVQIIDKIFYNVYYRTDNFGCASEMYYNKQYGVVGFNWQGEWYVLETDSL